jgi:iron complex transport system substrate-binding protein
MKKILVCILAMVLLASAMPLAVMLASAQQAGIPCDDGDNELTKDELVNAILPYMLEEEGAHTLDEVGDAAWVYAYWNVDGVGKPKTIVDDTVTDTYPNGKPVTIYRPPERIITLHSDGAEILKLLKLKDKIVGIGRYISDEKFFPDISKLPIVGSMSEPDAEEIIYLNPDIVIAYGSYFTRWSIDLENKLKGTGITLVRLDALPETMSDDIIKLGHFLDKGEEAEKFIDWHEGYLSIINDRVEGLTEDEKPRVYVENPRYVGDYSDYKTYSEGSGAHQACIMAGGINIAADLPGKYPIVQSEWVINQSPDIIVRLVSSTKVSGGYGVDDPSEMKAVWEDIVNRDGWSDIPAVRDRKVYLIHEGGTWNDPKYFIGLAYLAKWFNSTLFEDLDPHAIHKEYIAEFQGLDLDLDENGVFVYHPEKHPAGK